jgi:hypothetical protein
MQWLLIFLIIGLGAAQPSLDTATTITGIGNASICNCNPYIGVIPGMENMTSEEIVYVLGPGYGFNITRDGLLTFENGTQIQIVC